MSQAETTATDSLEQRAKSQEQGAESPEQDCPTLRSTLSTPSSSSSNQQLATSNSPVTIIEPRRGWRSLELSQLWRYRHLLWMFMWRDIKAQQKQTVLGFTWIIVGPLVSVAAMSLVFGRMLNVPSDGFPYPVFLFAGQFLWTQFSGALSRSTSSVVVNSNFIQKVYVPRLVFPLSASLGNLINICIVFPMILLVMACMGYPPQWTVIFCPLIILLALATGLAIGLWLAPLNVTYRDVGRLAGYALMLGMYVTPVIYPLSVVPERFRGIMMLNPMAGYIGAFRTCLYGAPFHPESLAVSVAFTLVVLVSGAFFFTRLQARFADVI